LRDANELKLSLEEDKQERVPAFLHCVFEAVVLDNKSIDVYVNAVKVVMENDFIQPSAIRSL
jgi:hypothetical protein